MASQLEVAAHLDLSDRRIRGLVKDGILPGSKGPGGYDLDACRVAYVRHLRGLASGQVRQSVGVDLVEEKQRLEVEKLRHEVAKLERAARHDDARWIQREDHWRLLAGLLTTLREMLDYQSQRAAPDLCALAGGDPENAGQLVDRLSEMINESYNELAGTTIEAAAFGPDPHENATEDEN